MFGGFFGQRARAFDGFEQARGCAIGGRERNRRFRNRRRVVRNHGRAAAERKRAVVKNYFRLANLDAAAASQRDWRLDNRAVVKRAVCGTEILEDVPITLASHFRVHTRSKRIGNAKIVASGTADSYTKPAEWKMVRRAVGILNYKLCHFA